MIVKQKSVYYCDFCKKHGLSRHAMELHERICTLNPERECRWKLPDHPNGGYALAPLVAELISRRPLQQGDIDWLHDEVDGCPACMLAALRQSGPDYHHDDRGQVIFDYQKQVEEAREVEREARRQDASVW